VKRGFAAALLAFALSTLGVRVVSAQAATSASPPPPSVPPATAPENATVDLQSPAQASTRYSAYTLPAHMVAFDSGALGIGGGDVVALMGISYGLGAGFQMSANLAHFAVGMFNLGAGYHFIDTR